MVKKKIKFPVLAARVSPETRTDFINKAAKFGGTSHVMRELVIGFIEDRITIKPPAIGSLYHVE